MSQCFSRQELCSSDCISIIDYIQTLSHLGFKFPLFKNCDIVTHRGTRASFGYDFLVTWKFEPKDKFGYKINVLLPSFVMATFFLQKDFLSNLQVC